MPWRINWSIVWHNSVQAGIIFEAGLWSLFWLQQGCSQLSLSLVLSKLAGLWFSLLFSQNYLLLLIMHRQNLQSFWETSRCKLPTYSVSNKMSSFGDLKSSLFLRNASPPGEKKKKSLNHCSGHWARVTASNLLNLPSWLRTLILLSSWDEDD